MFVILRDWNLAKAHFWNYFDFMTILVVAFFSHVPWLYVEGNLLKIFVVWKQKIHAVLVVILDVDIWAINEKYYKKVLKDTKNTECHS